MDDSLGYQKVKSESKIGGFMKDGKCPLCKAAVLLIVIGALNWGSIGLFGVNFVDKLLGGFGLKFLSVIYILVGISGVMAVVSCFKSCPSCKSDKK